MCGGQNKQQHFKIKHQCIFTVNKEEISFDQLSIYRNSSGKQHHGGENDIDVACYDARKFYSGPNPELQFCQY